MDKLCIIDALGPFVEPTDQEIINWSKVTFSQLETDGRLKPGVRRRIEQRFEAYTLQVTRLGYNAMSFDDLTHLVIFPLYTTGLSRLLGDYRLLYKRLFAIAKQHSVKILINTDYLSCSDDMKQYMSKQNLTSEDIFIEMLAIAFKDFPEIDGVILRVGENDGKDVKGHFLSKLLLRTPDEANALLKKVLPLFESHGKKLIFRTWTVGVSQIGDLIWNERTFTIVFGSIDSDALIISMKFGDTDFMRYLRLNPLFFASHHKKIIELQTRREWEGMGTFPSFVGWDYEKYFQKLASNDTIVGIHVWCQTGGWAKKTWTNVTFLKDSSFWNELNTYVTVKMYQEGHSAEAAIGLFCQERAIKDVGEFVRLLQLSEIAIKQGLYIRELAEQPLYFRRVRIPPLLWLTWDTVLLQPVALFLIRALVEHPHEAIEEARTAADATAEMVAIAKKIHLEKTVVDSLKFQEATFSLFVDIRKYLLGMSQATDVPDLQTRIYSYNSRFPEHYTIPKLGPIRPMTRHGHFYRSALKLLIRNKPAYRTWDRILLAASPVQLWLVRRYLRKTKSHLGDQSMGIDVLFQ